MSATAQKSSPKWTGSRPKGLARLSNRHYQQASWTRDDLTFEQDLKARSCTCEAGSAGHWCKHLTAAFLASFVDNMQVARQMPGLLRRKLLSEATHQGRGDIEMALVVAEWEEQRDQQNGGPAAHAAAAAHPVRLTRGERRAIASQERREHDAAKVAGWQQHSEEVAEAFAAEVDTQLAKAGKDWAA
jgi:hypothetical protein